LFVNRRPKANWAKDDSRTVKKLILGGLALLALAFLVL
jgi:hypothetical protein